MRGILDNIYRVAGAIAGICIVVICVTILVRVTGRWFGVVIPSSGEGWTWISEDAKVKG